jgi:hypothetical protein
MDRQTPPSKPELKLIVNAESGSGSSRSGDSGQPSPNAQPPKPDAYVQMLMDDSVDCIPDAPLRQFMRSVINEPSVCKLLGSQVKEDGKPAGLRIRKLREIAADVLRHAKVDDQEFQAVYVATFLHGIQYLLQPELSGSTVLRDVMCTLVRGPLQRLQSAHPRMAELVRLCMGWGNADEETVFTTWLEERMKQAITVLDLVKF